MHGLNLCQLYHCAKKSGVALLIYIISGANAFAMPGDHDLGKHEFAGLKPIADEELSTMRGGFRFSNGVTLDFALKVQSAIDGAIVHALDITGNKFKDVDPEDFRTVIQVGENNYADIPNTKKIKVDDQGNVNTVNANNSNNGGQPIIPHNYQGSNNNYSNNSPSPSLAHNVSNDVPNITNIESVLKSVDVNNFPGALTVIQNSLDNKVIQHLNVLDVHVSNIAQYKIQALTSQLNNHTLYGLH